MATVRKSVTLSREVAVRLEKQSKLEERTMTCIVNKALLAWEPPE